MKHFHIIASTSSHQKISEVIFEDERSSEKELKKIRKDYAGAGLRMKGKVKDGLIRALSPNGRLVLILEHIECSDEACLAVAA